MFLILVEKDHGKARVGNYTVIMISASHTYGLSRRKHRSLKELALNYPETAEKWDKSPDLCEFPGGETMRQVYDRVNAALDRIIAENPGRTVVVTTHGGVLRNLYARIQYGEPIGIRKSEVFGNTGVSTVIAQGGRLRFESINDLSHLPEDMRRPPTNFSFEKLKKENLI